MRERFIYLLLAVFVIANMTACSTVKSKSECRDLISSLETACNKGDVTGILDCINPDKSATLKKVVNMISDSNEKIISAVFDFLGISVSSEESTEEEIDTISIEASEYNLEEESGTIACTLSLKAGNTTIAKDVVFKVIKRNENWYIDGVSSDK